MKEGEELKKLGSEKTDYEYDNPSVKILETFQNRYPETEYEVEFVTEEFTSLCPKTGQPDFATFTIIYSPAKQCIESKSLKLYFFAFRNHGSFMETITNKIADDLFQVCSPHWIEVFGEFKARGGITINVTARREIGTR